jgi:hypothetical protein
LSTDVSEVPAASIIIALMTMAIALNRCSVVGGFSEIREGRSCAGAKK